MQNNDNLARDEPVETIVEIGEGNLDESSSSLNEVSQEETMVQIEPEKVDLNPPDEPPSLYEGGAEVANIACHILIHLIMSPENGCK